MKLEITSPPEHTWAKPAREERRQVALPAYALLEDRSTFSVTVLDLSYDGCMVETPVALLPGLHLKLSVLRLGMLDAFVRWYSNGKAGLSFKPDATGSKTHQPRQHERISLTADISLRRMGRQNFGARVNDLSLNGCKVEFVERPAIGERVWVKFEAMDALEGEVCWVDGFIGGIQFARPIYPAVFDLLLARLR